MWSRWSFQEIHTVSFLSSSIIGLCFSGAVRSNENSVRVEIQRECSVHYKGSEERLTLFALLHSGLNDAPQSHRLITFRCFIPSY
ncbi:hypothetical protein MHYP_G00177190 [Metynnis hypsauchen]